MKMYHFVLFGFLLISKVFSQDPNVQITLNGETFFGSSSTLGAGASIEEQFGFGGRDIKLLYPQDEALRNGCTEINATLEGEFIIFFDRGDCTFNQKLQTAQGLGAISVFVGNQENSLFSNITSQELNDVCDVDCTISNSQSQEICESNSNCRPGICLPAFISSSADERGFCCLVDKLRNMPVSNPTPSPPVNDTEIDSANQTESLPEVEISAVFIGIEDSRFLKASFQTIGADSGFDENIIRIKERFRFKVDPSVVILILLGTGSVSIACYIAGGEDRELVSIIWGTIPGFLKEKVDENQEEKNLRGGGVEGKVEKVESVELTPMQAVMMLICASVFLVGLFFMVRVYPQQVVIGIIVFFGIGAIYSTSYFFIRPIIRLMLPRKISLYLVNTPSFTQYVFEESYTVESLIGFFITVSLVVIWFVFRHERNKVWLLQNMFSVAVALLFLSSIKLNTLKTGFYLLVDFCIYDIFMVFLTPFFGAGSVMLEVATAGSGGESVENFDINEDVSAQVCERTEDEQMPMLFLAPRFDYRGGFGLLGLGDVLIPGIFMTYILRTDYYYAAVKISQIMIEEQKAVTEVGPDKFSFRAFRKIHYFFLSSVLAYLVALIVTFIANFQGWTINGVQGQPALLYIVPFVMVTFLLQLKSEKRKFLWTKSLEDLMSGGGDEIPEANNDVEKVDHTKVEDAPEEKLGNVSI